MWGVNIRNPFNGHSWFSGQIWTEQTPPTGKEEVLIIEDYVTAFSTFKSVSPTAISTTIVIQPEASGSVAITDILLTAKRKNSAVVSLRFTDGVNTEVLYAADVTNAELYMTHTVKGRMQGWKGARVELVIAGANVDVNCTLVYMKMPVSTLEYTDWDALR